MSAGELDLTTPAGRLVARQLGSVAPQYEVEQTRARIRAQKAQAADEGKYRVLSRATSRLPGINA
ncbi:hypothetical protein GWI34_44520 [Actinomadura sp. DSM 109109]|nr:hypothetical protein [Actinomadura lepetitiana]